MMHASNSYESLKEQIQHSLDFTYLCSHAVPALNAYMKAVENGKAPKIPNPAYFSGESDHSRLKGIMPAYKKSLGKFLVLSCFSYFESYIFDLFEEIIEFHGGENGFVKRRKDFFAASDSREDLRKTIKILREKPKKGKEKKYRKAIEELLSKNYQFPIDLLLVFGVSQLKEKIANSKSFQIPSLLEGVLGVDLTESEIAFFNETRELRNEIAHGKVREVDLSKAIKINKNLRKIAIKIDQHAIEYFFIFQE
jgi:hypothetical protein